MSEDRDDQQATDREMRPTEVEPISDGQRTELRKLAEAATPGRLRWAITEKDTHAEQAAWFEEHLSHTDSTTVHSVGVMDHPNTVVGDDEERPKHLVCMATTGNGPNSEANARFIAAASPANVLLLLAALDAAEADRDDLRKALLRLDRLTAGDVQTSEPEEIQPIHDRWVLLERRIAELEAKLATARGDALREAADAIDLCSVMSIARYKLRRMAEETGRG